MKVMMSLNIVIQKYSEGAILTLMSLIEMGHGKNTEHHPEALSQQLFVDNQNQLLVLPPGCNNGGKALLQEENNLVSVE